MPESAKRRIKITGIGKYLPQQVISSADIDQQFSLLPGTIEKKSGIKKRHRADLEAGESLIHMAASAARDAVKNAGLTLDDIDCLIFAGGVAERLLPCTASLIHKELGLDNTNIPAFDINSSCLSFVVALDTISYLVAAGRYQHVLIVSADIPLKMMNPKDMATYIIFGDGAAATVISQADHSENSHILHSAMQTHSTGVTYCDIRLGMEHIPLSNDQYKWENYAFHMDGKAVYKLIGEAFPELLDKLLTPLQLHLSDIDMIIPHQASNIAMEAFQQSLGTAGHKLMNIYSENGNQVASSIPLALHEAIVQNKIQREATVLLLGTSAGVSLAGLLFRY